MNFASAKVINQSAVNIIWVTEEIEYSLEVEWENPPTDVQYYKLKFRSVVDMDEKQVMVPGNNDPKSRYILSGLKPGTEHEVTVIPVKDNTEEKPSSVTGRTDRHMGRYTSADGDTKEIQVGSENFMITLLDLKPDMEYVTDTWAEKGPQRSKTGSTRAVTEIDSPTVNINKHHHGEIPITLVDSPKNLVTDQVIADSATISWDRVQAPVDRYVVSYICADEHTKEIVGGKDRSITILPGLKPGMKFAIHLWAELGNKQMVLQDFLSATEELICSISWCIAQGVFPPYRNLLIGEGQDTGSTTLPPGLLMPLDHSTCMSSSGHLVSVEAGGLREVLG
ncbi:hypothetical protein DUI87_14447 [Hirundo rustica rustica]|uniref:Fibronectin type-III domain-containing protein n=1 Tax=Hirundo rustica rustica TaxID=333673 RepID=A0A3M0K4T8_HIRRU|nr:hypothetical protein DUI87_14447 [Hirundo rustica rustica]